MKFILEMYLNNDAFCEGRLASELANALQHVARKVDFYSNLGPKDGTMVIRDSNGNSVGHFEFIHEERD